MRHSTGDRRFKCDCQLGLKEFSSGARIFQEASVSAVKHVGMIHSIELLESLVHRVDLNNLNFNGNTALISIQNVDQKTTKYDRDRLARYSLDETQPHVYTKYISHVPNLV